MVLALFTPALPPPLLHFCLAPELSKILVEWQAGFLNRRYLPDLSLFGTRFGEVWMDRVMRTDELIEIDVHTRVRVPLSLSLSLAPYYLSSGFSLHFQSCALALLPVLVSRMNFLPFVSLSFLEREGKLGLPCLHRLIPLHEATGSCHYYCPYAQTQHLSSAREDTVSVAASSSGLSPSSC